MWKFTRKEGGVCDTVDLYSMCFNLLHQSAKVSFLNEFFKSYLNRLVKLLKLFLLVCLKSSYLIWSNLSNDCGCKCWGFWFNTMQPASTKRPECHTHFLFVWFKILNVTHSVLHAMLTIICKSIFIGSFVYLRPQEVYVLEYFHLPRTWTFRHLLPSLQRSPDLSPASILTFAQCPLCLIQKIHVV